MDELSETPAAQTAGAQRGLAGSLSAPIMERSWDEVKQRLAGAGFLEVTEDFVGACCQCGDLVSGSEATDTRRGYLCSSCARPWERWA